MFFAAADFEFCACTQDSDGALKPPVGEGWILIGTSAAADGDSAVLIATWARLKSAADGTEPACQTGG